MLGQHNGKEKKVFKEEASIVIFALKEKTLPQECFFFLLVLGDSLKHGKISALWPF